MAKATVVGWFVSEEAKAARRVTRVLPSFNRVEGKERFTLNLDEPGGPRLNLIFDAQSAHEIMQRWLPYLTDRREPRWAGAINKNKIKRWEFVDDRTRSYFELTSGQVFEYFDGDAWKPTRMEFDGKDYYSIDGKALADGILVRVF